MEDLTRFSARLRRAVGDHGWNTEDLTPVLRPGGRAWQSSASLALSSEGKGEREAVQCLKRYLARSLFRLLENAPVVP